MADFANYVPKRLAGPVAVSTVISTIYTAPSTIAKAVIMFVMAANTTAVSKFLTMHIVPSAGSPASSNIILPAVEIKPKLPFAQGDLLIPLEPGDSVAVIADVAGINIIVAGTEIS